MYYIGFLLQIVLIGYSDQGTLFIGFTDAAKDPHTCTNTHITLTPKSANQQRSFITAIMKSNHNAHCCMLCVNPKRSIKPVILLLGAWKKSP